MKKKTNVLISIFTALVMACGLTACGGGNSGGGSPTLGQVNDQIQQMPTTSNENEIANAINGVFGADIELPQGDCSGQSFSYGGVSSYVVTVSGNTQTAREYYNSIKADMQAKGYTAEDGDLVFYKIVGTLVYTIGVEGDGDDLTVYTGVADFSDPGGMTPGGTTPGGTTPGGTTPGGTTPGGNVPGGAIVSGGAVGEAAPAEFSLPTNVKIVTSVYGLYEEVMIKIGNDYYYHDYYGEESFYAYNGTEWTFYAKVDGVWEYWGERDYEYVTEDVLPYAITHALLVSEGGYDVVSTGNSRVIAGVATREYTYEEFGYANYYWISEDGICFNTGDMVWIETWDTGVTSFGVEIPDPNAKTSKFDFDELPENVKITVQSGSGGYVNKNVTMIKIANDYAVIVYDPDDGTVKNRYFLQREGPYNYSYYTWVSGEWFKGGSTDSPSNYGPLNDFEHMFNNDVSKYVQGEDTVYAGQACTLYNKTGMYLGSIPSKDAICMHEDGFVLRYQADLAYDEEWTNVSLIETLEWDETVTSFGDIVVP